MFLAPGVSEEQLAIEFDYFQLPMVTELGHRDFAKQFSQPTHWHEEAMVHFVLSCRPSYLVISSYCISILTVLIYKRIIFFAFFFSYFNDEN